MAVRYLGMEIKKLSEAPWLWDTISNSGHVPSSLSQSRNLQGSYLEELDVPGTFLKNENDIQFFSVFFSIF